MLRHVLLVALASICLLAGPVQSNDQPATTQSIVESEVERLQSALKSNDVTLVRKWLGADLSGLDEAQKSAYLQRRMRMEATSLYAAPAQQAGVMKMLQDGLSVYGPGADAVMVLTAGNLGTLAPNVNGFTSGCCNVAYYLALTQLFNNVAEGKSDPAPAINVCVIVAQRLLAKIGTPGANVAVSVVGLTQWALDSIATNLKAEAELRWWNSYMQYYEQYSIQDWADLALRGGTPALKKRLSEFWDQEEVTGKNYYWTLVTFNPNYKNDFAAFYFKKILAPSLQGWFYHRFLEQQEQLEANLQRAVQQLVGQRLLITCRVIPVAPTGVKLPVQLKDVFISARVVDRQAADQMLESDTDIPASQLLKTLKRVEIKDNKLEIEMGLLDFLKETAPHPLTGSDRLVQLEAEAVIGGEQIELELKPNTMYTAKGTMGDGTLLRMASQDGRTILEPQYALRLVMPTRKVKVEVVDHEGNKTERFERVPIAGEFWLSAGSVGKTVKPAQWPLNKLPTVTLRLPAPEIPPPLPQRPAPDYGALQSQLASVVNQYSGGNLPSEQARGELSMAQQQASQYQALLEQSFTTYAAAYKQRAASQEPPPSAQEQEEHLKAEKRAWMAPAEAWQQQAATQQKKLDTVYEQWANRLQKAQEELQEAVQQYAQLPGRLSALRTRCTGACRLSAEARQLRAVDNLAEIQQWRDQIATARTDLEAAQGDASQAQAQAATAKQRLSTDTEALAETAKCHLGSKFHPGGDIWRNTASATVLTARIDVESILAEASISACEPEDALAKLAQADSRMSWIQGQALVVSQAIEELRQLIEAAPAPDPELERVAKDFDDLSGLTSQIGLFINNKGMFDLDSYDLYQRFAENAAVIQQEPALDVAEQLVSPEGWCTLYRAQSEKMWRESNVLDRTCEIKELKAGIIRVGQTERQLPNCTLARKLAYVRTWIPEEKKRLEEELQESPLDDGGRFNWQAALAKNRQALILMEAVWPKVEPHYNNRTAAGPGLTAQINEVMQACNQILFQIDAPTGAEWEKNCLLEHVRSLRNALGAVAGRGEKAQLATIWVRVDFQGAEPPEGYDCVLEGGTYQEAGPGEQGRYYFKVKAGEYTIVASANGFKTIKQTVTVAAQEEKELTLALRPLTALPHPEQKPAIAPYSFDQVSKKVIVGSPGMYDDFYPAWTPDGKAVIINTSTGLMLVNVATGAKTPLVTEVAPPAAGHTSNQPLGNHARKAFVVGDMLIVESNISQMTTSGMFSACYAVPLAGGEPQFLFDLRDASASSAAWPLLNVRLEGSTLKFYFFHPGEGNESGLYVTTDSPENAQRVASLPLILSPDGTKGLCYKGLYYNRGFYSGECKVFSFPAGSTICTIPASDGVQWVSWSPDSNYLVAKRQGPGGADITIYDLTNPQKPKVIEKGAINYGAPSWSPDGRHIICRAYRGSGREDCLMITVGR